jgi:hypothetical protein
MVEMEWFSGSKSSHPYPLTARYGLGIGSKGVGKIIPAVISGICMTPLQLK